MIYFIPILGALLGWFTNKLLLNFIFRNLYPARQQQLATQLGTTVAKDLFNLQAIADKVKDPSILKEVAPFIDQHIDEFLQVKLKEKLPVISMFVSDGMLDKIKEGLTEEIELLLPQLLGQFADKMVAGMDVEKTVAAKISDLTASQLESVMYKNFGTQLRYFTMIGAAMGFLIACITLLLAYLSQS